MVALLFIIAVGIEAPIKSESEHEGSSLPPLPREGRGKRVIEGRNSASDDEGVNKLLTGVYEFQGHSERTGARKTSGVARNMRRPAAGS